MVFVFNDKMNFYFKVESLKCFKWSQQEIKSWSLDHERARSNLGRLSLWRSRFIVLSFKRIIKGDLKRGEKHFCVRGTRVWEGVCEAHKRECVRGTLTWERDFLKQKCIISWEEIQRWRRKSKTELGQQKWLWVY